MNEVSKQRKSAYDHEYIRSHYQRIEMRIPKDGELSKRIKYALYVEKISVNELLKKSLEYYLDEKEY